ncbi:MAG: hypothetical protein SFU86_02440, partial [Pirellulaceae bacterium]|nr:hypothetical protein [Pirellulaceae bacterium]
MSASFFQLVSEKSRESPIWKGYSQLDRTQWLPAAALEELQLHHLRSLVAHCRREVPYYRDTYQKCGLQEDDLRTLADIRHLPLLARTTWQSHYAHLQAEHLPPPMREAGTASTSGTSGVAIELRQTNLTALWWLAFFLRDLEWCGIDPRGSLACIRAVKLKTDEQKRRFREGLVQPFWHASLRGIIQMGPCHGFDLLQDPRRQLEWLRTTAPRYLLGYPSNLDYLGQLLREERGQIPNLELIQSFAESLEDDMRERIETAFGVPVKNTYSCMEAGYLASPCPVGDGFHVHGENVILEVLDEAG